MKRTRIHTTLMAAALLLVGAALATHNPAPNPQSMVDVPPQIAQQAAGVFLYGADGNVVWADTFPSSPDDAVYLQAVSAKIVDAQGNIVFEGPVQLAASDGSTQHAYVMINGNPVQLEHLVRAVLDHTSQGVSHESSEGGKGDGGYEQSGSNSEGGQDGSYDSQPGNGDNEQIGSNNEGESGSDRHHSGGGDNDD